MMMPTVYATFNKRDGIVFREETYIQWGNSAESIGTTLLLNPGSAALSSEDERILRRTGTVTGKIHRIDPTMTQLIRLIEKIYEGRELNGRFYINNLFKLQNARSNDSIAEFEKHVSDLKYTVEEGIASEDELGKHPWILLGWGINSNNSRVHLKRAKKEWLQAIERSGVPTFGKKHPRNVDYYHPCPRLETDKLSLIDELVELHKKATGARP